MKTIILFLLAIGKPLYTSFYLLHIPKSVVTYYCVDPNSKIQDNEETQSRESFILKTDPNKKRLSYKHYYKGSGIDERYSTTLDETEYHTQMEKLAKFNYQMKLLKMLESNKDIDPSKLKAIEEYNFLYEKSKYITNIEAGGLYHSWDNPDF